MKKINDQNNGIVSDNINLIYDFFYQKFNVTNINTLIQSGNSVRYTSTSNYWQEEFLNRRDVCHINRICLSHMQNSSEKNFIINWKCINPQTKNESITHSRRRELGMSNGITLCQKNRTNQKLIALISKDNDQFINKLKENYMLFLNAISILSNYLYFEKIQNYQGS